MEFSSPLAAMRPQPHPTWVNDLSRTHMFPSLGSSFDFRTMSMHQQRPVQRDYFNARSTKESSPAASLAVDLDANWHIDKTPQVATPRRSLFVRPAQPVNNGVCLVETPPAELESIVHATPHIASSSPGVDAMDVSPLPHKPTFFAQVSLPSPTPDDSPEGLVASADLLSPPIDLGSVQPQTFLQLPERKRPVTRPALSRAKGYSTSSIIQRPASADNLPPFRFGNVVTSNAAAPQLLDGFTESPIEASMPASTTLSQNSARRPSFGANRVSGSPCASHVRKPSGSRLSRPPRKQMRRSLSMFQYPNDVMKEEQESFETVQPPPLMSMTEEYTMKLPHFVPEGEPDSLPRITQETMVDILEQKYSEQYSNVLVIDCRFEYEYKGGHIESAVNFNDKQHLAEEMFAQPPTSSTLIVFHCEYSVHRAPLTAKFIRNYDRTFNASNYPHLTYPEMYILDGGYKAFFERYRSRCQPQNYVEMNDQRHELACEQGMARVKYGRQKLLRHNTFAYGQTADSMDCSPTQNITRAPAPRSQSTFDIGPSIAAGIGEKFQRRMASY